MEVEAFSQKISNVISKGRFIIPDYQREYDWDEDEIQELLDDINEVAENPAVKPEMPTMRASSPSR